MLWATICRDRWAAERQAVARQMDVHGRCQDGREAPKFAALINSCQCWRAGATACLAIVCMYSRGDLFTSRRDNKRHQTKQSRLRSWSVAAECESNAGSQVSSE
jgi:hypothetical protein